MNEQEIFDKVVNHIRKQGHPAVENGTCAYRTEDGSMCAVGCLITDEVYSVYGSKIEGYDVGTSLVLEALDKSGIDVLKAGTGTGIFGLLRCLQAAHDSEPSKDEDRSFMEIFEDKAKIIANEFNLVYTPV